MVESDMQLLIQSLANLRQKHLADISDQRTKIQPYSKHNRIFKLFQRSKTNLHESPPEVKRKLVLVQDKQGSSHLYHKETTNADHPRLGKVPLERWQELSLNRSIITSNPDNSKQELIATSRTSTPSKPPPVTITNVNLFGFQNVSMQLSIQDILGIGMMLRFISVINQRHLKWLQNLSPPIVRWIVIAWEVAIISTVLWQIVLIVGWTGETWGIINRVLADGVQVVESAGCAIQFVFRRSFGWILSG